MPYFDTVPMTQVSDSNGRRAVLQEYLSYISQLGPNEAGKLAPEGGETVTAVRRRLTAAAKLLGSDLVVKRTGQDIYFWRRTQPRRRQWTAATNV